MAIFYMKKNIFKVMIDPRGFIKEIPTSKIGKIPLLLAWVVGLVILMREAAGFQLSLTIPFSYILLGCLLLAIPFGYIILNLFSLLILWSGKLFKGIASYNQIVSALTYSRVPEIFVVICWVLIILLLGPSAFTQIYVLMELPQIVMILIFTQTFFYIWEFVISLHTIGQVQGFSAWMSLWNLILSGVILMAIAFFFELLIALFFQVPTSGGSATTTALSLLT
jgi:hypothetical protein